MQDKITI